ncbi:hypothetical protein [Botrytis gemydayravirus 1]|nr:hypothetical protein [Botrytis gemydayravirus 1]
MCNKTPQGVSGTCQSRDTLKQPNRSGYVRSIPPSCLGGSPSRSRTKTGEPEVVFIVKTHSLPGRSAPFPAGGPLPLPYVLVIGYQHPIITAPYRLSL